MTSPVTAAVGPASRPATGAPAGSDSTEPFATALDGAMSHPGGAAGRTEADVPGRDGRPPGSEEERAPDGAAGEPADGTAAEGVAGSGASVAAAPGGLVAALWARLTGTLTADGSAPEATAMGTTAAGATATETAARDAAAGGVTASRGTAVAAAAGGAPPAGPGSTGRAHALATAPGLAHGLRGLPEQLPAGVAAGVASRKDGAAVPGPSSGPVVPSAAAATPPGSPGPVLPPPATAADAATALAAVGVPVVAAGPGGGAVAATPAPTVPGPGVPGPTTAAPAVPVPGAPVPLPAAPRDAAAADAAAGSAGGALPTAGTLPPVTGVVSGSAPGTGAGSGAEHAPADGSPGDPPAVATTGAAAASPVAPAARTDAGATGPAVVQPVAGQLARPVAVLRGGPDGTHSMTVVLTPETLGPVEVSVTLSRGTLELTLRGAHDHGRAALLEALPELRRDLEAAGLACSRIEVDRGGRDGAWSSQTSSQSSPQQPGGRDGGGGRGQQHERGDNGARPWHRPADNGEGHPARTRTASGLDVRV